MKTAVLFVAATVALATPATAQQAPKAPNSDQVIEAIHAKGSELCSKHKDLKYHQCRVAFTNLAVWPKIDEALAQTEITGAWLAAIQGEKVSVDEIRERMLKRVGYLITRYNELVEEYK